MKLTCERDKLLGAFQVAATVAPSRSPKPILQCVKLEVKDSVATLMATDLEVGVRIAVEGVQADGDGAVILPVQVFGNILREGCDEKLKITVKSKGIGVQGDHSKYDLPYQDPEEYPEVADFGDGAHLKLPALLFKELIRRTLFATDNESSRYALGGVLLEVEHVSGSEGVLVAVGTDGRRLAKMAGPIEIVGDIQLSDAPIIVPAKSMQLVDRAMLDLEGEVLLSPHTNDVLIRTGASTIYSRLVEGRFPKWREALPSRSDVPQVEVTVGPMYSALRQAAIVASDESRGIEFSFGGGSLVLKGITAETGQSRIEFPIPYDGEEITVSMNHRYVGDFLRVLDQESTFTVEVQNSESPALFTTSDGYAYVVMPLATNR
ncbi:MAG: DNA polymerase III subunit beta [Planctomycetota bacterium]|nr:DNA polymerase III subunit beta [Planctomycetota bacterium]